MMSIQDLVTEIRASAVCWENAGAGETFEAYYRRDANEMRHVAALLESGKSRAACRAAERLDQTVREMLSVSVWDYFDNLTD